MSSPFESKPGQKGVLVKFQERRWYLREWHSHDRLEMNFVISGNGALLLEDRRYLLQPGQLIWLWPGQRHIPSDWSSDTVLWIAEWDYSLFRQLTRRAGNSKNKCRAGDLSMYSSRLIPVTEMRRLQPLFETISRTEKIDTFNAGMKYLLFVLWDTFCRASDSDQQQFLHPKLGRVMTLLSDPHTHYSLEELAKDVRLTPHYLSEIFHRQTGTSIPEYRNRLRLNLFFRLYRESPELDLLTHALDSGFGSYAQFYRVFTKLTGQTPRSWLRESKFMNAKAKRASES